MPAPILEFVRTLLLLFPLLALGANRAPLQPNAFDPLPLTAVHPTGWLLDQLRIQAAGLTGHLDEFWPDLGPNSGWLGGTGESWERGPYYLDGLVPLAYLTNDPRLLAKVHKWVDWTLDHPRPNGWLGPDRGGDWWPNFVLLKVLTQYYEATQDRRVIPALERYFALQAAELDRRPLKEWAIYRWQDEVLSILWLYNRNGDARLLDLARKLHGAGHDWEAQFADFPFTIKTPKAQANLASHGVNTGMALKAAPVWWLLTGDPRDRAAEGLMQQMLDRYHGQPNGIFASDEHLAGTDPSQGTELCTVVESMFSLEVDLSILGEAALADRLERIAYNALPATLSPDLWAHQYDQQANQVLVSVSARRWTTNGPYSNIFGLEPNFGCCTANLHQGWPKLASHLWMAAPGNGLAAAVYGPSTVTAEAGGVPVTIAEQTDYPFRESVTLTIAELARPARFPLYVRIPGWAADATVTAGGRPVANVLPGEFLKLDREWRKGDRIELRFPMPVRTSRWFNNSIAVERGPLVFSLKIGEAWNKLKQTGPAADWEVFPTTPWNYALVDGGYEVQEKPVVRQPFAPESAAVEIQAKARRLPQWEMVDDSAGPLPESPVQSKLPIERVTLIPYGAAKLRITAFPVVKQ
jgi:hypothetical protein